MLEVYSLDLILRKGKISSVYVRFDMTNIKVGSCGDYASGTNHTLPTAGFTRSFSGVSLDSFVKKITFQQLSAEGLANLGPAIEAMAEAEGLDAHKNAVSIRLRKINGI